MRKSPGSRIRTFGAALIAVLGAGGLAATGAAPTAQATCLSAFGLSTSPACTSTIASAAIAIGEGAEAHADGLFGAAFAAGNLSAAATGDAFTFATAIGTNGVAISEGLFGVAAQLGANGRTVTLGYGPLGGLGLNIAVNLALGTTVPEGSFAQASGVGNIAANLFGDSTKPFEFGGTGVLALGFGNTATNLGGLDTLVNAGVLGGTLNSAFEILGYGNAVGAGPGPLALAGSIAQTGAEVRRLDPGININGLVIGGAASVDRAPAPAATSRRGAAAPSASSASSASKAADASKGSPPRSAATTSRGRRD